jgi:2-keto-4-pentenoate hydratase/2-oxohepta-3-ene-1,7-dioic acid hydratase in catechol pathway
LKLVTYLQAGQSRVGAVTDWGVVDLSSIASDMLSLIEGGTPLWQRARQLVATQSSGLPLERVTLLAPIPQPRRNIICLGQNYREHARESDEARGHDYQDKPPTFFTKATHTVNRPEGVIPFEADVSTQIDWEAELAVIIGRGGRRVPIDRAMEHVFGYTAINDVSARDVQFEGSQFFRGKSLDGACPMGPWIVTADEIPDPHQLRVMCRVNGVLKQAGNTAQMIANIPAIISILSSGMTLDAGDVISTGTPSGVGFARKPPEFLKPGDVVEVEIDRIGILRNRVE